MTNVKPYRHTQTGTVLIIGAGLSFLLVFMAAPFPEGSTVLNWLLPFYAAILLLLGWLKVEINCQFLVCQFGIGLIRKRFALGDIEEAKTVRNRWYYGWGIRWTPHGWLFNAAGLDAVEIRMSNQKGYRIGTDQPEELLRAIRQSTQMNS